MQVTGAPGEKRTGKSEIVEVCAFFVAAHPVAANGVVNRDGSKGGCHFLLLAVGPRPATKHEVAVCFFSSLLRPGIEYQDIAPSRPLPPTECKPLLMILKSA